MLTAFSIQSITIDQVLPVRQQVMYPGKAIEFSQVEGDEQAIHWGLISNQQIMTVISLFPSERYGHSLQFRKFATLVTEQGKGYGSAIMKELIEYTKHHGYNYLWCNARVSAISWYEKFGFIQEADSWIKNGIDYIILYKEIN